jgi:hypothetical protein
MSLSPTSSSLGPLPGDEQPPWTPALTAKEAGKLGFPKAVYLQLVIWAQMVVEHHKRLGTPRHLWEGNATHNDQFVAQYVKDGELVLAAQLDERIDPALDDAQELLNRAQVQVSEAARHPRPVTTPESGSTCSGVEAVALVEAHDAKIEAEYRAGKQHHRRVAPWVVTIGKRLPWCEALGLLAFITYFTDVPLLRPWEDWLGFTLGVTIVAVVIYGQTRLVHEGAEKHNVAREAAAEGNRHEAERAYNRRNLFVGLASTVALGITAGLIMRGTAVLGDARTTVVVLMVFLAVLTGLLMPTVSFLSVARDGSKVSRERDSVATELDIDHQMFLDAIEECRNALAEFDEIRDNLMMRDLPDVCDAVQLTVDRVHTPYTAARLLIGGLAAVPPARTAPSLQQSDDGRFAGSIGTGIPGARAVDLRPLFDRVRRLTRLDQRRTELEGTMASLSPHPWAKSRAAI